MPKTSRPNGLSYKEQVFADAIISGKSNYDAFIEAYKPGDSVKRSSIDTMAYIVKNRDHVQRYLKTINDRVENRKKAGLTMGIEDRKQIIYDRIIACVEKGDDAAVARYMDLLNKMEQSYVNINKNIDEKDTSISALSTAELKKIINSSTDT